jgi:hypothetical protein
MIKLKDILLELLNTYQVQAYMLTDPEYNITDILDQIRAVKKITIVRNITPEDYIQKSNVEYTLISIKFITRGDAKLDLAKFKEDVESSDLSTTDLRIPGVKLIQFKEETLHRL